jgi:hypothetical protein
MMPATLMLSLTLLGTALDSPPPIDSASGEARRSDSDPIPISDSSSSSPSDSVSRPKELKTPLPAAPVPSPDTTGLAVRERSRTLTEKALKGHGLFYFAVPRTSSAGNDPEFMEKNRKTIQGAIAYASSGTFEAQVRPFSPFMAYTQLYSISAGKTTTLDFREPYTDDSISSQMEFLKGEKGVPMTGTARLNLALGPAFGWESEGFSAYLRLGGQFDAEAESRTDAFIEDYLPFFRADVVLGARIEPYYAWKKGPVPFSVTLSSNQPILVFGPFKNGLLERQGLDWKCMLAANLFPGTGDPPRTDLFATFEHRRLPLSRDLGYSIDRFSLDFRLGHLFLGVFFKNLEMELYRKRYADYTRLEIREFGMRIGI